MPDRNKTYPPGPVVLAGVDGSDRDADVLALARLLAGLRGARMVVASVYHRTSRLGEARGRDASEREAAQERLAALPVEDPPPQLRTVGASSPAHGLHDLAESCGAEFVVVGPSRRAGFGRVLPGSTGEHLLQESPCAVALAPLGFAAGADNDPRVVAVGYDLTPESEAAVALGSELALAAGCTIRLLTVSEPHATQYAHPVLGAPVPGEVVTPGERLRESVVERRDALPSELRADSTLLHGIPAPEILSEAAKGVDLLLLGSRGYGPIGRVLMGSVARAVIRDANCPVIVVPRSAMAGGAPAGGRRAHAAVT